MEIVRVVCKDIQCVNHTIKTIKRTKSIYKDTCTKLCECYKNNFLWKMKKNFYTFKN